MKFPAFLSICIGFFVFSQVPAFGQCETWTNLPNKGEIEEAHVVYRQYLKGKTAQDLEKIDQESFNIAYNNWKKAYEAAPAADGQRPSHFIDGIKLLKAKMAKAADAAQKKEYAQDIVNIYDQWVECYPKQKPGTLGRKAFDMFYMQGYGFSVETMKAFQEALDVGGNKTEYFILEPLGQLMAYLFKSEKVSREEAQSILEEAIDIADYNIANNKTYGEYYESSKVRMQNQLSEVEDDIFDCEYFKRKLKPKYEEHRDSFELVKYILAKLKGSGGCPETDALVAEVDAQYKMLATEINEELEAQRRRDNPGYDASMLQKEGKYAEAVARYKDAVAKAEDAEDKAQFYYSMAFIQTWQLQKYSTARENARKAANLRPNWGKPYILIGDMYSKTASSCGDDWGQRMAILAAIEKWRYAKSIDSDVAAEASKKISNYISSLPERQDGFMRGIKEGQKVKVNCWIGETVRVQFK